MGAMGCKEMIVCPVVLHGLRCTPCLCGAVRCCAMLCCPLRCCCGAVCGAVRCCVGNAEGGGAGARDEIAIHEASPENGGLFECLSPPPISILLPFSIPAVTLPAVLLAPLHPHPPPLPPTHFLHPLQMLTDVPLFHKDRFASLVSPLAASLCPSPLPPCSPPLPPPSPPPSPPLLQMLTDVPLFHKDRIASLVLREGYVPKLLDLFRQCEDLENLDGLHQLYRIAKGLGCWGVEWESKVQHQSNQCEDLENLDGLHQLYRIAKGLGKGFKFQIPRVFICSLPFFPPPTLSPTILRWCHGQQQRYLIISPLHLPLSPPPSSGGVHSAGQQSLSSRTSFPCRAVSCSPVSSFPAPSCTSVPLSPTAPSSGGVHSTGRQAFPLIPILPAGHSAAAPAALSHCPPCASLSPPLHPPQVVSTLQGDKPFLSDLFSQLRSKDPSSPAFRDLVSETGRV
ncbi:unnamed protein product [Closterium sp. NIES-54]